MDRFGWFFPSLTSQPTPAAPHNRTKYQQPTCAMQFSPCVFLHGFCPVFQHAERDTYSRLCWSKFSIRLVGTVKLVCFLCEFWWWKVQLEYGCVWIVFSLYSLRNQHQQHHTTAQSTSNQLAPCNFHHVCSCMGSVLFSIMLKETHAVDYVLKYGTAQYLKVNVASSNWINQMWLYRILATPVVISCS